MSQVSNYEKLAAVNVNDKTEKKGKGNNVFTYLSWTFAVDELMRHDPNANWVIHEPKFYGQQIMVSCTVTAFDKSIYMWLPVMNYANQAIDNPSVTDINKAQMRCLVKAIACHGLGLYIYAGEDLPSEESAAYQNHAPSNEQQTLSEDAFQRLKAALQKGVGKDGKPFGMAELGEFVHQNNIYIAPNLLAELENAAKNR